jgi:hypothetical protein
LKFGGSFQRIAWLSILTFAFFVMSLWPLSTARAQVIERGVQGGVFGAIIGGIVGGGRGAGTGAAIGAGIGIVTGAAEADANARATYDGPYYGAPPPPGGSDLVYNIQLSLARLGYDPGPPDGRYGALQMRSASISTPTGCPSTASPRRNCSTWGVRPESRGASHHHSVSLVPKHGACAKVTANPVWPHELKLWRAN